MVDTDSLSEPLPRPPFWRDRRVQRLRWPIMGAVVVVALLIGLVVYLTGGRYENTDDASIQGATISIAPSISGRVIAVKVKDNQEVRAGETLFQIDGRSFQTAYAQASAALANARLQVEQLKATYQQRQADEKAAEDNLKYLTGEAARQKALVAAGTSTQSQATAAANQADQARQALAAAQQQAAAALAALGGDADIPVDQHPTVRQAQAEVATAGLNQSYINVVAPQDGVVTKVEQLQVGDYVNAGAPVFSMVSNDIWVEAEFKENQLEYMRPGQHAKVKIDAYPDQKFDAKVIAISPGTGSSFSLLPPENATGNWVKVTQRVPVRLEFAPRPDVPLESGLSATVTVDTLHHRRLFGSAQPAPATAP
ncbi:MAG: HlyD family secretion protein [Caulobacteraceae bacterium]|nr:HlyD family secretion protein [Caulobacteraceae bacterium]